MRSLLSYKVSSGSGLSLKARRSMLSRAESLRDFAQLEFLDLAARRLQLWHRPTVPPDRRASRQALARCRPSGSGRFPKSMTDPRMIWPVRSVLSRARRLR